MQDVQDVIETAIGGMPIEVTIEGRNRFTINVRYPRDLRQNIERLKQIPVPLPAEAGNSASSGMPSMGLAPNSVEPPMLASADAIVEYQAIAKTLALAQMNDNMGGGGSSSFPTGVAGSMSGSNMNQRPGAMPSGSNSGYKFVIPEGRASVPLGQIAEIKMTSGPPMIKDEDGMLVGYVYVDMDQNQRDIGGYVKEAKKVVANEISLPPDIILKWTGQYELLEVMAKRMKVVIPITLILVIILLYLNFRNLTETLIVLASVPFALVGSIWLMYFLGYNYSTATWSGLLRWSDWRLRPEL